MAVRDTDIDDEADGKGKSKAEKKPGQMKLVVAGAIAIFVAVLGAQVAAPLVTKMIVGVPMTAEEAAAAAEAEAEAEAEAAAAAEEAAIAAELAAAAQPEGPLEPAIYVPLDPPFVVSFEDEGSGSRFLQLTLQAMARNEKTIAEIKQHAPAIRNSFLFLISSYNVQELTTVAGKEKLRSAMLDAANDIMAENTGEPSIEELYFTSLVIQ
jgi:flagellar FliL protein